MFFLDSHHQKLQISQAKPISNPWCRANFRSFGGNGVFSLMRSMLAGENVHGHVTKWVWINTY
jgi:hypothetical protein